MTQQSYVTTRSATIFAFSVFGVAFASLAYSGEADSARQADAATSTAEPDGALFDLRYKFQTGDVLTYEVQHRASVRSTIEEVTQTAQTSTDSTKLWKITDVLPNGEIEFMNVVERVHMINQLPDRAKTEYDSERDKTPPPGFDDAAKAIGVPLSVFRITPSGKVVSRKRKHLPADTENDGAVVIQLPDAPVSIGATWDEPSEVTVQLESGGTKVIQARRHYKLSNVSNGIATIDVAYQVLSPVDSHIESQLVQRLMSGNVSFDIGRGRIVRQQMDVDKRILGFAGPTSSLHYVMRMEEKLVDSPRTKDSDTASTKTTSSKLTHNAKADSKSASKRGATQLRAGASPKSPRGSTNKRVAKRSRTPAEAKGVRR